MPPSENRFIVDGEHSTPLTKLQVQGSNKKVTDNINVFIQKQSVVDPVSPPPAVVPPQKEPDIKINNKQSPEAEPAKAEPAKRQTP